MARRRMFGPTQGQDERPPRVPVAGSRRGREHAIQRNDVNTDGYFVERLFDFPFGELLPSHSQSVNMRVMSMGGRYIVMPAIRGVLGFSSHALTGLELANLRLRLVLNGQDDWIHDGQGGNTVSFGALFSNPLAPWFWFEHPFRLRAGDNLLATVTNDFVGEGNPSMTPQLTLRMMDADIYWDLYGRLLDVEDAEREDLEAEDDDDEDLDDDPFFDVVEAV